LFTFDIKCKVLEDEYKMSLDKKVYELAELQGAGLSQTFVFGYSMPVFREKYDNGLRHAFNYNEKEKTYTLFMSYKQGRL
jgi:hypothetical protein